MCKFFITLLFFSLSPLLSLAEEGVSDSDSMFHRLGPVSGLTHNFSDTDNAPQSEEGAIEECLDRSSSVMDYPDSSCVDDFSELSEIFGKNHGG